LNARSYKPHLPVFTTLIHVASAFPSPREFAAGLTPSTNPSSNGLPLIHSLLWPHRTLRIFTTRHALDTYNCQQLDSRLSPPVAFHYGYTTLIKKTARSRRGAGRLFPNTTLTFALTAAKAPFGGARHGNPAPPSSCSFGKRATRELKTLSPRRTTLAHYCWIT